MKAVRIVVVIKRLLALIDIQKSIVRKEGYYQMTNNVVFIIGAVCVIVALGVVLYGIRQENRKDYEQYKRDKR